MTAEVSLQDARQPVNERILAGSFLAMIALAIAAVLLSTNFGVGIVSGSMDLVRSAQGDQSVGRSPLYTSILRALSSTKRSPVSAARWPGAILFAANVWMTGFVVRRFTPRSIVPAIFAGMLVLGCLPVLHSHTLVRPEPLICLLSIASLGFFESFLRSRARSQLSLALIAAGLAVLAGPSAIAGVPAMLLAFILARSTKDRSILPFAFALFTPLYMATQFLLARCQLGPSPSLETLAPAWIAALIFITTSAYSLLPARGANVILTLLTAASLVVSVPWLVMAQREGHDYATRTWSHSETVNAARRLPPKAVLYSNIPDVIALQAHRTAFRIPPLGDARAWNSLLEKLSTEDSFVICFNDDPDRAHYGIALTTDRRIEQFRQLDDGAIYRADASVWSGADRSAAYNPAAPSTPARRNYPDWMKRHYEYVARAKQGNCDLVFLGDSITDDYRTIPGAWQFFEQRYGHWRPANFGIDHDRCQHMLWRILNGECDGIRPKVAVVLIGTNNSADDTPAAIAKGVEACVRATQQKLPGTKILLLSIFPRGGSPRDNDKRAVIQKVNAIIAKLDNGSSVRYLDLYDKFLEPDGTLTKEVMYDGLHPSLKGYHIWADAMQPLLEEMMRSPATAPTK